MKLNKLVYIAHGWCLGYQGRALIDEEVSCWEYGPMIESLFNMFAKRYGNRRIEEMGMVGTIVPIVGNKDNLEILNEVWTAYCNWDAIELANKTNHQDSPWHISRIRNQRRISNLVIENFYRYVLMSHDKLKN